MDAETLYTPAVGGRCVLMSRTAEQSVLLRCELKQYESLGLKLWENMSMGSRSV